MSMGYSDDTGEPMGVASGGRFRWERGWTENRIADLVARIEADPDLMLHCDAGPVPGSSFLARYQDDWKSPYTDDEIVAALHRYGWL